MENVVKTSSPISTMRLRRKAVSTLGGKRRGRFPPSSEDAQKLLHELQVHQVELELQNEELRHSQLRLQVSRANFADLYEFAPVAYFTVDDRGRIEQANLLAARLLGKERQDLRQLWFKDFVANGCESIFAKHLGEVFNGKRRHQCDLKLRRADGSSVDVQLVSAQATVEAGEPCTCRMAVVDISYRKRAEEALRAAHETLESRVLARTRELSETNHALEAQIHRCERMDKALRQAHQELGKRVQERTAELWQTNQVLQAEVVQRKQAEEARQVVLRHLVEVQEAERRRVARELHDQFGQEVTALRLGLSAIKEQLPPESPLQGRLIEMTELVDTVLHDVHNLVWRLRPPALDDLGLTMALERYTSEWSRLTGVPVHYHHRGYSGQRLPSQIETTFYRISQEALTNISKHARAKRVSVILEYQAEQVGLIIEDDGRGFAVERILKKPPNAQGNMGLLGMRERAMLAGGTWNIESARGSGTTVFVRIPIRGEKRE